MEEKILQPRRGAIAYNSKNRLGLITSESMQHVIYGDKTERFSWVGIQLTDGEVNGVGGDEGKVIKQKIGSVWMSREPKVICYIDDIIELIEENFNITI